MSEASRKPLVFRRWWFLSGLVLTVMIALLPWWRNHDYLRDFYDYGLVVAALGLIEQGQLPYVDFTTPIQAGFFGIQSWIETLGGGDYMGLTLGGAVLVVVMSVTLSLMLSRHWPAWIALTLSLVVTVSSASQHTILWHNTLGVACLALVAWSSAVAPVWRRSDWGWHTLTFLGLLLGGFNKLNFHLVAMAVTLGWSCRAWLMGESSWWRAGLTVLIWLLVGSIVPFGLEMVWTGASVDVWLQNVVGMAGASRAEYLRDIFAWKFLLAPVHDYYGSLALPQVGLVGSVISLAALVGCWVCRDRSGGRRPWDALLLPLAVIIAAVSGAALLATNHEIAYVGWAAWLVLIVALWLGFAPESSSHRIFLGGLVLPAIIVGAVAWGSSWEGQRSQFGYDYSHRDEYELADSIGDTFGYFKGTYLPPGTLQSMQLCEQWLPKTTGGEGRAAFYGAGMEWMHRILPGMRGNQQPLWVHWDTTYGPREIWNFTQRLHSEKEQKVVLTLLAREDWPPVVYPTLRRFYHTDLLGPVVRRWYRMSHQTDYYGDSFRFVTQVGGNVSGDLLRTVETPAMVALPFGANVMLGVMGGEGRLLVSKPTYRFGADVVLERTSVAAEEPLYANFKVIEQGAVPEKVRWAGRLELPPGEARAELPFVVDALGKQLQLRVFVPDEFEGLVSAGYRNFQVTHAIDASGGPPRLREGVAEDQEADERVIVKLMGTHEWRPKRVVLRGISRGTPHILPPNSEIWLRTEGLVGEIRGQLFVAGQAADRPTVRVIWYKGGRMQIMQQGQIPGDRPFNFHVWCAEPGGWIAILVDQAGETTDAARLQIDEASLRPM